MNSTQTFWLAWTIGGAAILGGEHCSPKRMSEGPQSGRKEPSATWALARMILYGPIGWILLIWLAVEVSIPGAAELAKRAWRKIRRQEPPAPHE